MALFSPPTSLFTPSSSLSKANFCRKLFLKKSPSPSLLLARRSAADNGAGVTVVKGSQVPDNVEAAEEAPPHPVAAFKDPRWVKGTWDLTQFEKNGSTDWDTVIDAG